MRILGVRINDTAAQSANNSWSTVTGRIRAQARDAYSRELCLDQRILYLKIFLLANAWYTAQIFLPPEDCMRQLNSDFIVPLAWGDL